MEESEKFSRRDWDSISPSVVGCSAGVGENSEEKLMLFVWAGCCCCCFWSACHWPNDDILNCKMGWLTKSCA